MGKEKAKEFIFMQMESNLKDIGKMEKNKAKEFILMKMEENTKENGQMVN